MTISRIKLYARRAGRVLLIALVVIAAAAAAMVIGDQTGWWLQQIFKFR